ncbi:hypothetical protein [Kitasatospora purpeofusca]|uniref:hypothetical protein n=1 Tax=Kitasatospora purpeofusca TaxID=67352 RepID=UPI0036967E5A
MSPVGETLAVRDVPQWYALGTVGAGKLPHLMDDDGLTICARRRKGRIRKFDPDTLVCRCCAARADMTSKPTTPNGPAVLRALLRLDL